MTEFVKQCAEASAWMLKREVKPEKGYHFWQWSVLTEKNTDPDSPDFSEADAGLIFAHFIVQGMLVPGFDNNGQDAYRINHGQKKQWDQMASPRFHVLQCFSFKIADMMLGGAIGFLVGLAISNILGL